MEPGGKRLALGCSHWNVKKHTRKEERKSRKGRRLGKKNSIDVKSCMVEEEFVVIEQGQVTGGMNSNWKSEKMFGVTRFL